MPGNTTREWRQRTVDEHQQDSYAREQALISRKQRFGTRLHTLDAATLKALHFHELAAHDCDIPLACRAIMPDGRTLDPCLAITEQTWLHMSASPARLIVGGEVDRLEATDYALPYNLAIAASRTREIKKGTFLPLLVEVNGNQDYLVSAGARLFAAQHWKGAHVSPRAQSEPDEQSYKKGLYTWSDDFFGSATLIVMDWPDVRRGWFSSLLTKFQK